MFLFVRIITWIAATIWAMKEMTIKVDAIRIFQIPYLTVPIDGHHGLTGERHRFANTSRTVALFVQITYSGTIVIKFRMAKSLLRRKHIHLFLRQPCHQSYQC